MARKIWDWFILGLPFHRVVFWLSFILSIILIVAGFIVPPLGAIDSSVLISIGEIFAFAALGAGIKAIEDGKEVEFQKKDIKVTVGDAGEHFNHNNHGHYEDDVHKDFIPKPLDDED